IPLLVVGVILIIAEGGQVTKTPRAMYPGYPPGYAYPPYHSASSGRTRSTGCQRGSSASRGRDGSFLHELRFAEADRDLVLPELRRPRRAVNRRAMPLWRESPLRRSVPPCSVPW